MGVDKKRRLQKIKMLKVFLLLSLAILSTIEKQDFTHFRAVQIEEEHAPRENTVLEGSVGVKDDVQAPKKIFKKQVRVARRLRDNKRVQQPITASFNHLGFPEFPSTHPTQLQPSRSFEKHPVFVSNGNLVEQTKAFVDSAKNLFEFLEHSEQAQLTFVAVFDSSDCLGNVTDVIALMDEIVKLVEKNAPEIIYLEALIESLKNERDIDVLILASSKMLRALGHIMPALSNPSPKLCITNPEDSVRAFKSMSHAMIDIRNHREIEVDETARQLLEFSSKVMYDTGKFLFKMNKSLKSFRHSCQNNQMKDVAVYNTIVDIMESLADLFNVLDMDDKSNAIKEQIEFVKRIVRPFNNLDSIANLDIALDCDFQSGSYEELAQTLDDLGSIIKDVGIETLAKDLGIDFELSLIHEEY